MQDEKERGTELDYCDLDPTKICLLYTSDAADD